MEVYLRSVPGTIYLTVMGNFGRLWVGCWWDSNVYEEGMIKEWVDEVAGAAKFYLGTSQAKEVERKGFLQARL
jgi:hypothetical protein